MSGDILFEVHDLNWRGGFKLVVRVRQYSDDIVIDKQGSTQGAIVKKAMENLLDDRYFVGSVVNCEDL